MKFEGQEYLDQLLSVRNGKDVQSAVLVGNHQRWVGVALKGSSRLPPRIRKLEGLTQKFPRHPISRSDLPETSEYHGEAGVDLGASARAVS